MVECQITLIHPGDNPEDDEKTVVFAEMNPIGGMNSSLRASMAIKRRISS